MACLEVVRSGLDFHDGLATLNALSSLHPQKKDKTKIKNWYWVVGWLLDTYLTYNFRSSRMSVLFSPPRPVQKTKLSEDAQTPDTLAQLGEV